MTVSIAQKPIAIAAVVRTKWRRLLFNFRRHPSTPSFWRGMIAIWSFVGGGGRDSSFEHGSTSTGSPSHWSGQDRFHFSILSLPVPCSTCVRPSGVGSLDDLEGTSHRRVDPAVVRDDLTGAIARGRRDRRAPLRLVLDPA